jgi:hypothetical protein
MTNKFYAGLLVLFILPVFSFAQASGVCGTSLDTESAMAMNARTLANRQIMDSGTATERDDEVVYIPIKYHLFGKADGSQVARVSNILGLHCRLNEEYAAHDIQFYINDGFEYYFNDTYYDNPSDFSFFLDSNRSNNSVNVWIGKDAIPPNAEVPEGGVIQGYYSPSDDWIVLRKAEAAYNKETFAHEMGHFLSLDHPFNGWECMYWGEYADANPGECAPTTSTCGFVPTERADGSNCATAGDYICDTPANYAFGYSASGCSYNGNACDPTGAEVNPDPTNIMGYFTGCPDSDFTPEQIEMALVDYNSNFRNYLRSDGGPTSIENITTETVAISPEDEADLSFENVTIDWEDTPNAERYLIQTALNTGFSLFVVESVVEASSIYLLDYLNPNTTYYWHVGAYNEYHTCINWSETRSFTAGTGISSIETVEGLTEFVVSPNPANAGSELTFSVNATKSFSADFELISVDGKTVYNRNGIDFTQGNSSIKVNTQSLSAGLYFATLRSANGIVNKRIVITE